MEKLNHTPKIIQLISVGGGIKLFKTADDIYLKWPQFCILFLYSSLNSTISNISKMFYQLEKYTELSRFVFVQRESTIRI